MHANISILSQYSGDNLPSESSFPFHTSSKKFKSHFWQNHVICVNEKLLVKSQNSSNHSLNLSPFTFWTDRTFLSFGTAIFKDFSLPFWFTKLVQIGNFVVEFYFAHWLNKNAISFYPSPWNCSFHLNHSKTHAQCDV